jgi:hypothetical protein
MALVTVLAQQRAVLLWVQPRLEHMVAVRACSPQLTCLTLHHCWAHFTVVLVGAWVPPFGLLARVCEGTGGPVVYKSLHNEAGMQTQSWHSVRGGKLGPLAPLLRQ